MSSPFPQVPLPLPIPPTLNLPIGFWNQPSGSTPGQFNNNEQQVLATLSDAITSQNPTVISQGAVDLFATEAALLGKNLKLQNFVTDLINLDTILAISNAPANLQSLVTNPEAFFITQFLTGSLDSASSGLPSQVKGKVTGTTGGTASISAKPASIGGKSIGLSKSLASSTSATGGQSTSVSQSNATVFGTQFQPLVDAFFGQSQSSTDVWNSIQTAYNFFTAIPGGSATGYQNFITLATAFNQGGLLSGGVDTSQIPYYFPVGNSDSFTNFITSLLTLTTQPGVVIAEVMLAPGSLSQNLSFSYNVYSALNKQIGGAQGATAKLSLGPLVDVLFGFDPAKYATSSTTDPFNILFSLVSGPSAFVTGLFSTNTFNKNNLTPQSLIGDLFSNPTNFPSDLLSIVTSSGLFPAFFQAFFTTATNGSVNQALQTSPQKVVTDLFTNPAAFPYDMLNLVNVGGFGLPGFGNSSTGVGYFISQIFASLGGLSNIATNALSGRGTQKNVAGLNDSVQFGNIPIHNTAGSTATPGWGSSAIPGGFPSTINGYLPGDLGYAMMCAAAASSEIESVFSYLSSNNFLYMITNATTATQQFLDSIRFSVKAINVAIQYLANFMTGFMNVANVINNSSIPGSQSTNFPLSSINANALIQQL